MPSSDEDSSPETSLISGGEYCDIIGLEDDVSSEIGNLSHSVNKHGTDSCEGEGLRITRIPENRKRERGKDDPEEELRAQFKSKVIISSQNPINDGQSTPEDIGLLMNEVLSSLDSDLQAFTANQISVIGPKPPDFNQSHMDISPSRNTVQSPPKSTESEIEFDNEFDDSLLEEIDKIEKANANISDVPNTTRNKPENEITAYWIDAFEKNATVYVFCKVSNSFKESEYLSCCCAVKNIPRNIFFLPRKYMLNDDEMKQTVGISDVKNEIDQICKKSNIKSYTCNPVTRSYAFGHKDVPLKAVYLKLVYSYQDPAFPKNLSGETFSRIFGVDLSALQLLLIKRKLMGPSWINIRNYTVCQEDLSWCKMNILVENFKDIHPLEQNTDERPNVSPLDIMAINMRTIYNLTTNSSEIVILSGIVIQGAHVDNIRPHSLNESSLKKGHSFNAVCSSQHLPLPRDLEDGLSKIPLNIEIFSSEREILGYFMSMFALYDPDIVCGYDITGGLLNTLKNSLKTNCVMNWSCLGRLRRKIWPKIENDSNKKGLSYSRRSLFSGRIFCDIKQAAEDLVNLKSYDFEYMAKSLLNIDISEFGGNISRRFSDSQSLAKTVLETGSRLFLILDITNKLQVLPLYLTLTNISGNLWSRSITGARSNRNEYLLLHEFHKRKYILPDKSPTEAQNISKRKPAYSGGLVLEPRRGFYDTCVLLLDFNSLYPSIIQEYNICFTTIPWTHNGDESEHLESSSKQGVLPELLRILVERRRMVKSLMKDPNIPERERNSYDIRQKALKLTANSMYGCLGFQNSRFYAKQLAVLITSKGRDVLQDTVNISKKFNLDVIYGDTDSIMILTKTKDYHEALNIGKELKNIVNRKYRCLEIEIESVIGRLLLHRKKKYACKVLKENHGTVIGSDIQVRGLEVVRREWCDLVHSSSNYVLSQIFSDSSRELIAQEIGAYLENLAMEMNKNEISCEKFIIRKMLSKDPNNYADKKSQPHVMVALAMREKGINVEVGDTISYIICKGDESAPPSLRAHHSDEVIKNNLTIDYTWYISNQLISALSRLVEPFGEMDTAFIAKCFGLENFQNFTIPQLKERPHSGRVNATQANRNAHDPEEWTLTCGSCLKTNLFVDIVFKTYPESPGSQDSPHRSGFECPEGNCQGIFTIEYISNNLLILIRKSIRKHLCSSTICEDNTCLPRIKPISVYGDICINPECRSTIVFEYSSRKLYDQLIYYRNLLDLSKCRDIYVDKKDSLEVILLYHKEDFEYMLSIVNRYLEKNSYGFFDLGSVFAPLKIPSVACSLDISDTNLCL